MKVALPSGFILVCGALNSMSAAFCSRIYRCDPEIADHRQFPCRMWVTPTLSQHWLPERSAWLYESKADGYRSIAFKTGGRIFLRSRNDKDFNGAYPGIVKALAPLPDETIIDGEVVALDEDGRPSFNLLPNSGSRGVPIVFYIFDLLMLSGEGVMKQRLSARRELIEKKVLPKLSEPIRYSAELKFALLDLIQAVKAQGFEGLVAKRRDSKYEPGLRSGSWQKMRINRGQDFVIGGYTVGGNPFDAVVFGYYEGDRLIYAARTRNGFTPSSRASLFKKFKGLEISDCPFVNLPEKTPGRWGQGLTQAKMVDCRWLKPVLVGQFEFTEWTGENHLRHSRFVALRENEKAKDVTRERG
jgi:DNA ligase D-like protein (predicted ligase)